MQFSITDIQAMADPKTFLRGVEYFKSGRVRSMRYRSGDQSFNATVAGSGRQKYDTTVFKSGALLAGFCTCPVSTRCKHCVAAALEWKRRFSLEGAVTGRQTGSGSSLEHWLADMPKPPTDRRAHLSFGQSYVLYFLEERVGRIKVFLHKGYLKKNGEWSRITPYTPDYFALKYTPPAHVQPEDAVIIQLLPTDSGINGIDLEGEAGRLALTHMLATRRVYYEGRPLSPVPPERLNWTWKEEAKAFQLAQVLEGRDRWHLLATEPPCFLDGERAEVGELLTPVDRARLGHLRTMPPVPAAQISQVAVTLRQWFDQSALPLPVAEPEVITADTPVPCLTLVLVHFDKHAPLPTALIHFEYAGLRLQPNYDGVPLPPVETHEIDGKHIQIKRDLAQEVERVDQIHQCNLHLYADMGEFGDGWSPDLNAINAVMAFWQSFIETQVPALEQQGWRIDTHPDFALPVRKGQFDFAIKDSSNQWFEFALSLPMAGKGNLKTTEVVDQWLQQGTPDLLTLAVDDEWVQVDAKPLKAIRDLITDLYHRKQLHKSVKLPAFQVAQLQSLPNLDQSKAPATRALLKQLQDFRGIETVTPSKNLQADLRSYQQEGLNWLVFLHRYRLGGILADDMGLGKTLQTLALLQHLKDARGLSQPALILAPTSLIGNWQHEAARFTPQLRVTLIHGPDRFDAFKKFGKSDVLITTYPLLLRDKKRYEKRTFSLLILDEAQAIKNPASKVAQAVGELKGQTRLCLTGTPLENHLGELWSLMNFALPGLLGGQKAFRQNFRTPIENQGDAESQKQLAERVAPFMLRRTKQQVVKELPAKSEQVQYVELEGQQRVLYESIRVSMEKRIRDLVASQGMARSHIEFLDALLKLRQACIDPRLVKLESAAKIKEHAKLNWLAENLPQLLEEGRNVLIFSQFTQVLGLIEAELKTWKIAYSKLTGQTRKRQEAIDQFQSGETRVFLISLKAGGSGLNLTAADVVIHMDPWWNPAVENQATDRAYRIGQDKPVFVYKLVAADTIEERIQLLQQQKQALADNLFSEAGAVGMPKEQDVLLKLLAR